MQWKDFQPLRECPFCGGEEIGLFVRDGVMRYYWYECAKCYCGTGHEESEDEARAAWNRRAQPENEPLTLEELRQMDGEPVWVVSPEKRFASGWMLVVLESDCVGTPSEFLELKDYGGNYWLAYRTKPEGSAE